MSIIFMDKSLWSLWIILNFFFQLQYSWTSHQHTTVRWWQGCPQVCYVMSNSFTAILSGPTHSPGFTLIPNFRSMPWKNRCTDLIFLFSGQMILGDTCVKYLEGRPWCGMQNTPWLSLVRITFANIIHYVHLLSTADNLCEYQGSTQHTIVAKK